MKTIANNLVDRVEFKNLDGEVIDILGLTKRELFAIHALQGLIASEGGHTQGAYTVATKAVTFADSLILALNNLQPPQ